MQTAAEREAHLRVLANQLFFVVEKTGQRFTLKRTTDVPKPVYQEGLRPNSCCKGGNFVAFTVAEFQLPLAPSREHPRNKVFLLPRHTDQSWLAGDEKT
jgi:hypothetical protein